MSTTAAINPKGPRVYLPGQTPGDWAQTYLGSTVGQKVVTALTGLGLTAFVIFHMVGNLKVLNGPDAINAYAHFLKHDIGVFLWLARGGLLAIFLAHVGITVYLHSKSAAARPTQYAVHRYAQASVASRSMLWTGVVIGLFTVFHVAHYTLGWVKEVEVTDPASGQTFRQNYLQLRDEAYFQRTGVVRHDVYSMVVAGFRDTPLSLFYVLCQAVLALHLSHGVKSSLQTLGLVGRRFSLAAKWLGLAVALTVFAGNTAIVAAVWSGYAPESKPTTPVYKAGNVVPPAPSK